MQSKRIFLVFGLGFLLFVSFSHTAKATPLGNNGGTTSGYYEVDGDNETKDQTFWLPGPAGQTFYYGVNSAGDSNDPGSMTVDICFWGTAPGAIFCETPISSQPIGNSFNAGGYNPYRIPNSGDIGGGMGLNDVSSYRVWVHIWVDSSSKYKTGTTVTAYGRYVVAGTLSASATTISPGDPVTLNFNATNGMRGYVFNVNTGQYVSDQLSPNGSWTTHPSQTTTYRFAVYGPGLYWYDDSSNWVNTNDVTVTVASFVNLNFQVTDGCSGGLTATPATITLNNDYGGGTTTTANGSGFATISVSPNTNIGWSSAVNGYDTVGGSVNSGNGTTVNVVQTRTCGGGTPTPTPTPTPSPTPINATPTPTPSPTPINATPTPTPSPTPTCQDSAATNYGGPLPCTYSPAPTAHITANGQSGIVWVPLWSQPTIAWVSNAASCNVYIGTNQGYDNTSPWSAGHANYTATSPPIGGDTVFFLVCDGGASSDEVTVRPLPASTPTPTPGSNSGADSCTVTVQARPGPSVSLTANPSTLNWNNSGSTLNWSSSNADACGASVDWSGVKALSGSQGIGALTPGRYTYVLTCSGNGSGQSTAYVTVNSPVPTAYSVTHSEPDYCLSGPGGYVAWSYSDPSGSPQTAYEVKIGGYDSGKLTSSSKIFAIPNGALNFNNTYNAQVMVWNTYDQPSAWSTPTANWTTPPYAYPDVISPYQFTWPTPPKPQQNKPVQFTDHTVFGAGGNHSWSWNFGDGGTSTQPSPAHTYTTIGNYTVNLIATDAAGQSCGLSQSLNVQKPIPVIKEVAPK